MVCMLRMAGIIIPGQPHHVVQRGNNRQVVFFVDDDRRAYVEFLRKHRRMPVLGRWAVVTRYDTTAASARGWNGR